MKETKKITYDLKAGADDSSKYYEDARSLGREILEKADRKMIKEIMDGVDEKKRYSGEYVIDMIFLGVLWNIYSEVSQKAGEMSTDILSGISELREDLTELKDQIDLVKGPMNSLFLSSNPTIDHGVCEPSMENLEKIIRWLDATGDFRFEVDRFRIWQKFLKKLPKNGSDKILNEAIRLGEWFQTRSLKVLGKYTLNVEPFLSRVMHDHLLKEDIIFCSRRRVEYHLNMACSEIMNDLYREEFKLRAQKVVLLPVCLRDPVETCKAERSELGFACVGCSTGCNVKKITEKMLKNDVLVLMLPHSSETFKGNEELFQMLGVVGISCPLNLVQGGWKAREMGIFAQCVVLEYCGCSNHWDEDGIVTDINMNRLNEILVIN